MLSSAWFLSLSLLLSQSTKKMNECFEVKFFVTHSFFSVFSLFSSLFSDNSIYRPPPFSFPCLLITQSIDFFSSFLVVSPKEDHQLSTTVTTNQQTHSPIHYNNKSVSPVLHSLQWQINNNNPSLLLPNITREFHSYPLHSLFPNRDVSCLILKWLHLPWSTTVSQAIKLHDRIWVCLSVSFISKQFNY